MCLGLIRAGPVEMDGHKQDEREDIEKKVDIFHILNGILAEARNVLPFSSYREQQTFFQVVTCLKRSSLSSQTVAF